MATLMHFVRGIEEFVYILTDDDEEQLIADYAEDGWQLSNSVVICGDDEVLGMPTDRELRP